MLKKIIGFLVIKLLVISWCPAMQQVLYSSWLNLYAEPFKNPFETVIIITKKGDVFYFSNHLDSTVRLPLENLIQTLKQKNSKIEDIILIIHNHFRNPNPSPGDKAYLRSLINKGFHGFFGVYHTPTKTIKWVKYKKRPESLSN